jgi:anti-sigma regulatory factor (Ser/Thr protein kinase)
LFQITTALGEAITNAIDHGCLELDSELREESGIRYRQTAEERSQKSPYRERRVHVTARLTPDEATYVVRDEGPGFDPAKIPDPADPANLLKASGRGLMLIRTFMDEVSFNDKGNEITMIKRRAE